MAVDRTSVVFTFDSTDSVLEVSYIDGVPDGELQSFKVIDIPVTELSKRSRNDACSFLGEAVATTFEQFRTGGIGLQQDSNRSQKDSLARADAIIEERARAGDVRAQNAYAMQCLSDSLATLDESLLDVAEEWLGKAAAGGNVRAERFMESWPRTKETYRKLINDRRS